MKKYLLTTFWLGIFTLFASAATFKVPEKPKPTIPKLTLTDAFHHMGQKIKNLFVPKAIPIGESSQIKAVEVSSNYSARNDSVITAAHLNAHLDGVLQGKGEKFIAEARKNEICPIVLTAICLHESACGKSKFSREKNNVFGIFLRGKYHTFDSVDDCIEFSAKLLGGKLYAGGRNDTVGEIQKVYCPVGAANDPKGINKYWLTGVLKYMKKIFGEEIYVKI